MTALAYTAARIGFLALLWIFIFIVVRIIRRDVAATQVRDRRGAGMLSPFHRGARYQASTPVPVSSMPASASNTFNAQTPEAMHSAGASALSTRRGSHSAARPNYQPAPAPARQLIVTGGSMAGTALPLTGATIVVGRSQDSALVLSDSYVSSRHARIFFSADSWWIEDLDSTNGTFVDGRRISQPTRIVPGMKIVAGKTPMELRA